MLVILTEALRDGASEVSHHLVRGEMKQQIPGRAVHAAEHGFADGGGLGRANAAVDQGHLAEIIVLEEIGQRFLLTGAALLRDLDRAFADEIKRIARLILGKDDLIRGKIQNLKPWRDLVEDGRSDALEQRVISEERRGISEAGLRFGRRHHRLRGNGRGSGGFHFSKPEADC